MKQVNTRPIAQWMDRATPPVSHHVSFPFRQPPPWWTSTLAASGVVLGTRPAHCTTSSLPPTSGG
jgi:hypothetical protein